MPINFDMCSVSNDHNIWILHKVTPLDLLAQVAGPLGDNRRLYSDPTVFINSMTQADIAFCNVRQAIKLKLCTMSRRLTYWFDRRFYLFDDDTFSTALN